MTTDTRELPLGKRIERRRLELEMSREELAGKAQTSYQHIYAIETGLKRGSDLLRTRIAKALRMLPDAFLA